MAPVTVVGKENLRSGAHRQAWQQDHVPFARCPLTLKHRGACLPLRSLQFPLAGFSAARGTPRQSHWLPLRQLSLSVLPPSPRSTALPKRGGVPAHHHARRTLTLSQYPEMKREGSGSCTSPSPTPCPLRSFVSSLALRLARPLADPSAQRQSSALVRETVDATKRSPGQGTQVKCAYAGVLVSAEDALAEARTVMVERSIASSATRSSRGRTEVRRAQG